MRLSDNYRSPEQHHLSGCDEVCSVGALSPTLGVGSSAACLLARRVCGGPPSWRVLQNGALWSAKSAILPWATTPSLHSAVHPRQSVASSFHGRRHFAADDTDRRGSALNRMVRGYRRFSVSTSFLSDSISACCDSIASCCSLTASTNTATNRA